MASKIKQEISEARTKLDDVLQLLVEQAEDSGNQAEELKLSSSQELESLRDLESPSKKTFRIRKKRGRKDVSTEEPSVLERGGFQQHSYVMKLFDRSVNLAQFKEKTPLYPICRDWMYNQPHIKRPAPSMPPSPPLEPIPGTSSEENGEEQQVYCLPLPTLPPANTNGQDFRIPSPLPQPDQEFTVSSDSTAPSCEQLLKGHLQRWKAVRQKWKISSQKNQLRYKESYTILKAMYDRQ